MATGFNHEQFSQDMADLRSFFTGFFKSLGFASKKAEVNGGQTLGFWEERYIRFRLNLVEMGISKVIRTVILIIVSLVIFLPIFIESDTIVKIIVLLVYISFYTWLFMDHLVVDKKPVGPIAAALVKFQQATSLSPSGTPAKKPDAKPTAAPAPKPAPAPAPAPAAPPSAPAPKP